MTRKVYSSWSRTGDYRIAPSWFGLMRAEAQERRDITDPDGVFGSMFQLRWVPFKANRSELDEAFYSTMAGDTTLRRFVTWWRHP